MTGLAKLYTDISTKLLALQGNFIQTFSKLINSPGADNITWGGNYIGNGGDVYTITIERAYSEDNPETFSFTFNGFPKQSDIVIVAGQAYDLANGVTIKFASDTDHTIDSYWRLTVSQSSVFKTVRLWNSQIKHENAANYPDYAKPAAFIEFDNMSIETGGGGYQNYGELIIRIHIQHEFLDDQSGNFEQDLPVFDLKERVFYCLHKYQPDGAASLMRVREAMDYDHGNTVHYIMEFKTNFEDELVGEYIIKYPPSILVIDQKINSGIEDKLITMYPSNDYSNIIPLTALDYGSWFTTTSKGITRYNNSGDSIPFKIHIASHAIDSGYYALSFECAFFAGGILVILDGSDSYPLLQQISDIPISVYTRVILIDSLSTYDIFLNTDMASTGLSDPFEGFIQNLQITKINI